MPFPLDAAARRRILDFVRPLSVGLDGVTNFGFVVRRLLAARRLAEEERALHPGAPADSDRLFLLASFAGTPERRFATGERAELLLASAGVPPEETARLRQSLRRFESAPKTREEELVHDAALLESVGAYGVTQALAAGRREGMTLAEMADEIERRLDEAAFATEAARRLAAERVELARRFARSLREEAEEFGTASDD